MSVLNYENPDRAAIYVTAEWGDFLASSDAEISKWVAEWFGAHPTIKFYRKIKEIAFPYLKNGGDVLDVGSATGRLLYELALSDKSFASLTGCEMSKQLSAYSSNILLGTPQHSVFPMLGDSSYHVDHYKIPQEFLDKIRTVCAGSNIIIRNDSVDNLANNGKQFDTVFCLNVVDRHPSPKVLAEGLANLVKSGGVLCVACAFDWARSPAGKQDYCDDLNELFGDKYWSMLERHEVDYTIIGGNRQGYVYRTQVVVYKRS